VPRKGAPFYTHVFGSLGSNLETARRSDFFQWFHLQEATRRPEPPGELLTFRPEGAKFRELCSLQALATPTGEIVRLELIVGRSFIEGNQGLFAQDLLKSFLNAALTDACKELLRNFLAEMNEPGRNGETIGYTTFRGRNPEWATETGWSRLRLANVLLPEGASLVVAIEANPTAPNAKLISAS
jgi:hypothetical protein